MAKKTFDLHKYISEICEELGVKPDDNIVEGSETSEGIRHFSYKLLITFVLTGNWDPAYSSNPVDILSDETKFNEFFNVKRLESGLPSTSILCKHIHFIMKLFKREFYVSNIKYTKYIEERVNAVSNSNGPVIIYGESGVGKYPVANVIHEYSNIHNSSFRTIDCSDYEDDQLCLIVFGEVKDNKAISGLVNEQYGGTLYIQNIQSSGKKFQNRLSRFLDEGKTNGPNSTILNGSDVKIICSIKLKTDEQPKEVEQNINKMLLFRIHPNYIHLMPLRVIRSNLPFILFMTFEKIIYKRDLAEIQNGIDIPIFLIQYWLTYKNWHNNNYEIKRAVELYINGYLSERKSNDSDSDFSDYQDKLAVSKNAAELKCDYDSKIRDEALKTFYKYFDWAQDKNIKRYVYTQKIIEVRIYRHFNFIDEPFLWLALVYTNRKTKQFNFNSDNYLACSPKNFQFNADNLARSSAVLTTKTDKDDAEIESAALSEPKENKFGIIKFIVEVDEKSDGYPQIKYAPTDGREITELIHSQNVKAEISLLVFLIYEKFKTNKDGSPNTVRWGTNWLANIDEYFEPFINLCRWFGYGEKDIKKRHPGWRFSNAALVPSISRLKIILDENNISRSIITIQKRKQNDSIYHLHKDLEAEVIIKNPL